MAETLTRPDDADDTDDTPAVRPSRQEPRALTRREKGQLRTAQDLCQEVLDYMRSELGTSRDLSIARAHIETAAMWLSRHITK